MEANAAHTWRRRRGVWPFDERRGSGKDAAERRSSTRLPGLRAVGDAVRGSWLAEITPVGLSDLLQL